MDYICNGGHANAAAKSFAPLQAYLFERLRLGVPGTLNDIMSQRHRLLAEYSSLNQLVHQYNTLLQSLSKDERRLMKDRIRYLFISSSYPMLFVLWQYFLGKLCCRQ